MFHLSPEQILGIILFIVGNCTLSYCSIFERNHDNKLQQLKTAGHYGRRESDAHALKVFAWRGSAIAIFGFGLALYGIFLFFGLVNLSTT